jgi:hypothetical protein
MNVPAWGASEEMLPVTMGAPLWRPAGKVLQLSDSSMTLRPLIVQIAVQLDMSGLRQGAGSISHDLFEPNPRHSS